MPDPWISCSRPARFWAPALSSSWPPIPRRCSRFYGSSHLFFLLEGYAGLDRTAMPMVGDPETTYDTFVPQLVADAEAAVAKAVEMGITDPERIGVIGHSHGGLMVANLLAHTDRRPRLAMLVIVVTLLAAGYLMGAHHQRLISCEDFEIAGQHVPENCRPETPRLFERLRN